MRTTLTLDDDLAGILQRRSRELGKPFKEMINATLRRGLAEDLPSHDNPRVITRPKDLGLPMGIYAERSFNKICDGLEVEAYLEKAATHDPA